MSHFSSQSKLKHRESQLGKRNKKISLIIGLLFGFGAMTWFISGIDWTLLTETLANVSVYWILLSSILLLFEFVLRAVRWKFILQPVSQSNNISVFKLFIATVLGATANTLFPLRAGELLKPYIINKEEKIPFSTVIATTVMERVYDIFGLVFILISMLFLLNETAIQNINSTPENADLLTNLQKYGGMFGVFALFCMMIFFYLASRTKQSRELFSKILFLAPLPVKNIFLRLFDGFVEGLGNTKDIKGILLSCFISILLWSNGACAIYCLFQAFGFLLPFGAACFVSVAIALTVALPQAPGFIGVFHVAMEKTILLWGEQISAAQGFAIVFWAVSFIPVTSIGFLLAQYLGIQWSEIKKNDQESLS